MKKTFSTCAFLIVCAFALSSCAVENDRTEFKGVGFSYHSDIKQLPDGNYYVEVEAAPGQGRIGGASANTHKDATKYCSAQNKAMRVIDETKDSHLLVNGVSRLTFSCE